MARVQSIGLAAEADIYLPDGPEKQGTADQLRTSGERWRGWDGDMEWHSWEGELSLVWNHDGLGHVSFAVTLRPPRVEWEAMP